MPSHRKSETARANGAKSRGPVTPEGRAASSGNAVSHGLSARVVVLPAESREQFQLLLDSYLEQFHPHGPVEIELVEAMAAARWRLRRVCTIETNVLNTEMVRRAEDIKDEFTDPDDDDRLAWVFQKLADHGQTLALLVRYEAALNRSYDRAFKQLTLLQSVRNRPLQNEPKPDPPPTTAIDSAPCKPQNPPTPQDPAICANLSEYAEPLRQLVSILVVLYHLNYEWRWTEQAVQTKPTHSKEWVLHF